MAMKNLFTDFSNRTYIISIIIGVILYIISAEVFLRVYVIPHDRLSQIAVSVYESENRNVIIGDSQIEYGFPKDYPGFENLSINGMPVETMEIILREYYMHKKPGKIIIIAGPQMLAENRVERGDWGFKDYFKLNTIDLPFMLYAFEKLVSKNLANMSKWTDNKPDEQFKENLWEETANDKRIEMSKERMQIQRPVNDFYKTNNFKSYYRLVKLLKEKGAKVCLLRMPISVEYQELIRNDKAFLDSEASFKEMAKLYEVTYVDFKQIPLSYDASFFINSDHLNEKSRKLFAPLAEKFCFSN
jgi:hypothetical protein